MADKKIGMSFQPEAIGLGPEGEHVIVDANHYIALVSASQGTLYYIPRENKYYRSEGKVPCKDEDFKKLFLRYLRWDYDQLVDETVDAPQEDGSVKKLLTGCQISLYPATPENIASKREELITAASRAGEMVNMNKVLQMTSPRELKANEAFDKEIDKSPADIRLARRINKAL